ncbi:TetR/AcrR family transcriptional regulator [Dermatobacter hominis]|uniref:TetR/AcrR family transcriptional regulator n=1 Tax=Dermatobacter hominis TaxID=2884263 RepID=UPI001D125EA5|nr:TetR/AcrR family transcriptional regulator [Dermatobacter hominis]UDY37834.1 TetR/AcrR family transcriptional regulator [Dermatobacter hominis]
MNATEARTDPPLGRRARNRAARHDQLLAAASDIVEESGLEGLTMQAVADRVDCAVGTIYTYFASKSALIAALQVAAVQTLLATYHQAAEMWDEALEESGLNDDAVESLVRVLAYGQLFVAGPELHPREFEFLQMLLSTPERLVNPDDVRSVTPHALTLLAEGLVLVEAAVAAGALSAPDPARNDDGFRRLLRWVGALNGALLTANANVGALPASDADAFSARAMGKLVTEDLLLAWGAPARVLDAATEQLGRMQRAGSFLPRVGSNA